MGYLTLAPDLFSDGGTRRCLAATIKSLSSGQGKAYADIEAARQWLLAARGLHRADRHHRLLHGRRLRADDAGQRASRWPRRTTASCRGSWTLRWPTPVRWWPVTAAAIEPCTGRLPRSRRPSPGPRVLHDVQEYPDGRALVPQRGDERPELLRPLARVTGMSDRIRRRPPRPGPGSRPSSPATSSPERLPCAARWSVLHPRGAEHSNEGGVSPAAELKTG